MRAKLENKRKHAQKKAKEASAAELEPPSVNQQAEPNVQALDDDGLTLWGEFGQTAEGQVAACETPVAVESCAECCAFEKVADADGSEGVIVSFMLECKIHTTILRSIFHYVRNSSLCHAPP